MASKCYTNLSMIIVLGLCAGCGKSQGPVSAPSPITSPGPVNQFCQTADFKDLCTKMVRGATNLHDAIRNAVESGLNIALKLQQMMPMLEPAVSHLPPKTKESVLDTCRQDFEKNIADYQSGLKYVDQNDLDSLNVHLSAVTQSDCFDSFEGCVMPQPVADRITMMKQASSNCLAVSEQK